MIDPIVAGLLLLAGVLMLLVLLTQYRLERKIATTESALARATIDFNAALSAMSNRLDKHVHTTSQPLSTDAPPVSNLPAEVPTKGSDISTPTPDSDGPVIEKRDSNIFDNSSDSSPDADNKVSRRAPPRLPKISLARLPSNITPRVAASVLNVDLATAEAHLLALPHRRVGRNVLVSKKEFLRFYNQYRTS
jgi:hypothetical protein